MKNFILVALIITLLVSCQTNNEQQVSKSVNWGNRAASETDFKGYLHGKSYLPVYSHIYHIQEHKAFDLTITISIRNISATDSIYILNADYYNTKGDKIRQYLEKPAYISPMETVEIIIAEKDKEGGSGANFVFDWAVKNPKNPPLIEAVMISTLDQQGISFTTRAVQVAE